MPRPFKLSGQKDAGTPRRQWRRRTPVFTPSTSRRTSGSPPRGPDKHPRGPCGPRALRGRPRPLRGAGSARERPVSHRPQHGVGRRRRRRRRPRRRHLPAPPTARGPRRGSAGKVSLLFSRPSGGPPDDQARGSPTQPGADGRSGEGPTSPLPGRRARTLLALPPQLRRVCSQRPRAAGAIRTRRAGGRGASQTLAGDPPALRSKPTTAAGAGLSLARAQRAATHTPGAGAGAGAITPPALAPHPFLACSLAPPGPSRAPGPRGRGQRGGHTRLEAGARDWLLCSELRARALTWIGHSDAFTWAAWRRRAL